MPAEPPPADPAIPTRPARRRLVVRPAPAAVPGNGPPDGPPPAAPALPDPLPADRPAVAVLPALDEAAPGGVTRARPWLQRWRLWPTRGMTLSLVAVLVGGIGEA